MRRLYRWLISHSMICYGILIVLLIVTLVVCCWPHASQDIITLIHNQETPVWSIAFSPDGATIASGGDDARIVLWKMGTWTRTANLIGHSGPVYSIAFSSDGRRLVSASHDSTIRVWLLHSLESSIIQIKNGPYRSLKLSPDGRYLAASTLAGDVDLYASATMDLVRTFENARASSSGVALAFSEDSKSLFTGGDSVVQWDVDTGKRIQESTVGLGGMILSLAKSPKCGSLAVGDVSWRIKQWDGIPIHDIGTIGKHRSPVNTVSFSHSGTFLASAEWRGSLLFPAEIKIWRGTTFEHIQTLKAHYKGITSVAFSPLEDVLASASYDGTVKIWNMEWEDK